MKISMSTDLKTRVGDTTKDARLKNAYVEVKGEQSVVRKRPTCVDGIVTNVGTAQGGYGDFVINGDVLSSIKPSIWTTRAFNVAWIADHVAAGFGALYQFEWGNATARKSTDLGVSWSNVTMPVAIDFNRSALFVSNDIQREIVIVGDSNESAVFTKDGANFYEITMPAVGLGSVGWDSVCTGNFGSMCVLSNGVGSKAVQIVTGGITGTGYDMSSYVPFSATFSGEFCCYFLGSYYIFDGTNKTHSLCSFYPTIWNTPKTLADGMAAFSWRNVVVIDNVRVIIIDNNGDTWIATPSDRYIYGLRFRKIGAMPNGAAPYQTANAGLYILAWGLTDTYVSFDNGDTWEALERPPIGGNIAIVNGNCALWDESVTSIDALEGQKVTL